MSEDPTSFNSDPNCGVMPVYGDFPTIMTVNGFTCVFYLDLEFIDYMDRAGKDKAEFILRHLNGC